MHQPMHERVFWRVRTHLCDTVFINSSPLGGQHHNWCEGRKLSGIKAEVTPGKVLRSLLAASETLIIRLILMMTLCPLGGYYRALMAVM